jgi:hypothetical protein
MSFTLDISKVFKVILIVGFTSIWSFIVTSQNRINDPLETKEIQAYPLNDFKLDLDGVVDEAFWMNIDPEAGFLMQVPIEGNQPTERTEVRVAYDAQNLYIAAIFYDSEPSHIKAFQKRRDTSLDTDDRFRWIFDTFNDKRRAYFFEINPFGLRGDGLISSGQGQTLNMDWDGIWKAWTYIGDFGWSVEIRIPFMSLNFNPNSDTWGVNFQRTIRRKNEELLWAGHRRNQGLLRPQNAGLLTGIKDPSQGIGLELVPYAIATSGREYDVDADEEITDTTGDFGFDINYNITPSLRASITYNTDFAQTEVDDRQINLTRFPLRFPEKRDFFLEGSSILSFAPSSGPDPYFSRRIGLVGGRPIPIDYGGRLLGNIGKNNIALIHVKTAEQGELNSETFTVARYRRDFWKESSIGLIYTSRSTKDNELLGDPIQDRRTIGADLTLSTSEFFGDKILQFSSFFVGHNAESPLDDTTSLSDRSVRGLRINFPNRPWYGWCSYREFGTHYNPAVGFNRRNGFRRVQPGIYYAPLFEESNTIREIEWGVYYEYLTSLENLKLTENARITLAEVTFESGARVEVETSKNYELLQDDFDIFSDGEIIIIPGKYTNWTYEVEVATPSFRKISGSIEYEWGGFWTGRIASLELGLVLRPSPGINIEGDYTHTRVTAEGARVNTNLFRLDLGFDFTPDISLSSNIQYEDVSKVLGTNTRFRWILTPGTDIFFVYNHNWLNSRVLDRRFTTLQQVAALKAVYTHRF